MLKLLDLGLKAASSVFLDYSSLLTEELCFFVLHSLVLKSMQVEANLLL